MYLLSNTNDHIDLGHSNNSHCKEEKARIRVKEHSYNRDIKRFKLLEYGQEGQVAYIIDSLRAVNMCRCEQKTFNIHVKRGLTE